MAEPPPVIDLRSDTVTRPDAAMREAMARAAVGDDVLGDDPTVQALEERAARITGKEAALFVPSGTMGNSIAIAVLTRPGDEVILESQCHSFNFECGGAARLWGVQTRPIAGERGQIPLEAIEAAIRPEDDIHEPRTRLVILEQTSNVAGGCVLPLEYLRSVGALCRKRGLAFHIDGARVFNASVASGVEVAEYAAAGDTVMFCISKGLGAPVGSLLAGSRELMEEARRIRKLLGGGLRQAGVLAACGLHALERNVERLAEDHRHARELADLIAPLAARGLEVTPPETNMVYLSWPGR
ncbi:MAG: low-specificity L-threonine aldolase, partial [Planctomycetes bacterium]|nr:low-specificity L-threonine aldolase [Planctomycetota bacterium]